MTDYQVLARRYRPKVFQEVVGQEPIVRTLKNALQFNRLAHAYLFCGSRGTGKTTLARLFAKALNCEYLSPDFEPCSKCASCLEIASSSSIDVLEIDGASNRGIDDIRVITESVGYAPTRGKFKIYLIDEVHMLTKEAFNALLKTLEEPPAKVKFFFATTEPHKLPPTILSRCQRFNLRRIPLSYIVKKLAYIAKDLNVEVDEEVLYRIADYAEGGLRDAESLFDQIIAFSDGKISAEMVHEVLGVMPRDKFFEFDRAFQAGDHTVCFQIGEALFLEGKDLGHFLEDLAQHYRKILLLHIAPTTLSECDSSYKNALAASKAIYSKEQCLTILDLIIQAQQNFKGALSEQLMLEALLLRILRERKRLPIECLVERLSELEKEFGKGEVVKGEVVEEIKDARLEILPILEKKSSKAAPKQPPQEKLLQEKPLQEKPPQEIAPTAPQIQVEAPIQSILNKARNDTLIQFAAVELEGTIQRKK